MALPTYADPLERAWYYAYIVICTLIFIFLIAPILVIMPLSFNAEPYFTFTSKMLSFDPEGYSLRWYDELVVKGMQSTGATGAAWWSDMWQNSVWVKAAKNSVIIGFWATILSTVLGTLAALGLSRPEMPYRRLIMAVLISPMIVPIIIVATGMFFFYSNPCSVIGVTCGTEEQPWRLTSTYTGVILAHAALGIPFVIITVTATLSGFDQSLIRAAASLGANPRTTFFKVIMPLILPGVISGALFAFVTSFDEVVAVLLIAGPEQQTIPRQMWNGIREAISPAILAVATILVVISIALLTTIEVLRRRSDAMRGVTGR
ncbi:ABC transporter permease [Rhodobacter sp. 24-YEA-8]|uniref:ABC transporter permease n=1 Tax=Rhodobacter sp. 24-YEA-8 TaxID=1884310 RepID=UPI00089A549E|nr:ABC transporter permease [Rhodobacter sp. 24-YEA-8]SEB91762.1 putative spermidine/putrescine transport system permease protein [Rhodobacter sp. 24-YEA-8]